MKKRFRMLAAVVAAFMLMSAVLAGCGGGSAGPTAEDAAKYVQAVLDLMCTGEYDTSVTFADVEEGKELELRNSMIDEIVDPYTEELGLSEDVKARFKDYVANAFAKCRYTVGEATEAEGPDGEKGFDVPVTIEPLKIFDGLSETLEEEIMNLTTDVDKLSSMTEEELYEEIFDALFKVLNENLEDPQYGDPQEVVVHYGLLDEEKKMYGVDEEAGQELGSKLFYTEGLE